jgi:RNA polymerase sigma-70 factor (ECF subfamily)
LQATAQSRPALERLCHLYWQPVYGFIRTSSGSREEALDLTQDFFADLVTRGQTGYVRADRGRFRAWLMAALRNFLENRRAPAAADRGARFSWLDPSDAYAIDALTADGELEPERAYARAWALGVLKRALSHLEKECEEQGKSDLLERLKPFLVTTPASEDLPSLGRVLGLGDSSLKVTIFRLRRRLAGLVRAEVCNALPDRDDRIAIEQEMNALLDALVSKATQ